MPDYSIKDPATLANWKAYYDELFSGFLRRPQMYSHRDHEVFMVNHLETWHMMNGGGENDVFKAWRKYCAENWDVGPVDILQALESRHGLVDPARHQDRNDALGILMQEMKKFCALYGIDTDKPINRGTGPDNASSRPATDGGPTLY